MDNQQIANVFEEIGNLLEVDGANRFRVLAYQNVAENIRGLGREIQDIWKENPDELDNIPGVGHDLRLKIEEMLTTGFCEFHQKLVKKYGRGILDILQIRGIGPKKVALFYQQLKIDNLEKLKAAALAHKLSELPRMGKKSEEEILNAIEERVKYSRRMLLSEALPLADKILAHLCQLKEIALLEYAGSLRRRKETIGDLDFLAAPQRLEDSQKIIEHFQKFPLIKNIIANGPTKCSVILENGVQADLRVVEVKSFGAALHYFTGSKDHNVEIRTIAQKAEMKINEYGIWELVKTKKGEVEEKFILGDTEENFYKAVGLTYIPPVLREMRGEFTAAINKDLPILVQLSDLKGDLNLNTLASEGKLSLEKIAEVFSTRQLEYLGIADTLSTSELHSPFTSAELEKQLESISKLQKKYPQLQFFKSVKIPINSNGSLDLPAEKILKQLDYIIIKISHDFNLTEPKQTARVLKALQSHPKVKILSCPNARILNQREILALKIEKVIDACAYNQQFLEVNSQPDRLDLPDYQIKLAIQKGAQLAINSDFKSMDQLNYLQFVVWTAQRGWAETHHIINTLPLARIKKLLAS
jgi:DNA polymerase (family 10)